MLLEDRGPVHIGGSHHHDLKDDSKQKIESKRARRMEELGGTVAGGLPSCLTRAIVSSFIYMYVYIYICMI